MLFGRWWDSGELALATKRRYQQWQPSARDPVAAVIIVIAAAAQVIPDLILGGAQFELCIGTLFSSLMLTLITLVEEDCIDIPLKKGTYEFTCPRNCKSGWSASPPHLVLGLISQIIKIQMLADLNLKKTPQLLELFEDGKDVEELISLPPEKLFWDNPFFIVRLVGKTPSMYLNRVVLLMGPVNLSSNYYLLNNFLYLYNL
ncbi:hypothetical protein PIB30_081351 [Stylosanthes scabra]|uniref:Uncharacterized protein n=1 Tax=Stylosanthes scabra TaxID=79078 RepID=A0ABU6XSN8_9FABA|nr:hypothetical protein [Stylosanthes scabra]